MLIILSVLRK